MARDAPVAASGRGKDQRGTFAQRWLGRLSVLCSPPPRSRLHRSSPALKSLAVLVVGLSIVTVSLASSYLFLARRWFSLAVFVLAPVAVMRCTRSPACVDLDVDLGEVGGRTFVNNASFSAYAKLVQTPAHRDDKIGTTLDVPADQL